MQAVIRFLADGLLIGIVIVGAVAAVAGFQWRRWRVLIPYALMAGLTSLLVAKLASLLYQPSVARPFLEKGTAAGAAYIDNPGFPSDHMLVAVVIVCALYVFTPYRKLTIVLAVAALIMGVARVLALVHTPIDILGGVIAGLAGCIWYLKMRKNEP